MEQDIPPHSGLVVALPLATRFPPNVDYAVLVVTEWERGRKRERGRKQERERERQQAAVGRY